MILRSQQYLSHMCMETVSWKISWQVTVCCTEVYFCTTWLSPFSLSAQYDQPVKYEALFPDGSKWQKNALMIKTTHWKSLRWCFWHITQFVVLIDLGNAFLSPEHKRYRVQDEEWNQIEAVHPWPRHTGNWKQSMLSPYTLTSIW